MKAFHHALLIGNGTCDLPDELLCLSKSADLIVAADGGANIALQAGISPHVVIGDLDSVSATTRQRLPHAQWIFVDNQNNTDLQKALDYLVSHKCKCCTLVGFGGGRIDFALGNLLALHSYVQKMELCWLEKGWKIYPICKPTLFNAPIGTSVSLIPLTTCYGVTLRGLQFSLCNARLPVGTTRSISNRTTHARYAVSLTRGTLLVCQKDTSCTIAS